MSFRFYENLQELQICTSFFSYAAIPHLPQKPIMQQTEHHLVTYHEAVITDILIHNNKKSFCVWQLSQQIQILIFFICFYSASFYFIAPSLKCNLFLRLKYEIRVSDSMMRQSQRHRLTSINKDLAFHRSLQFLMQLFFIFSVILQGQNQDRDCLGGTILENLCGKSSALFLGNQGTSRPDFHHGNRTIGCKLCLCWSVSRSSPPNQEHFA